MPIGMRIVITHSMPIGTSSQCCSAVSFLNIRELVMPSILSINTTAIAHFGHQRKPICFNHSSGTATANFHPFHPGALGIHQTCTVFHIGALTASHSSSTHIHTYSKKKEFLGKARMIYELQGSSNSPCEFIGAFFFYAA